ncbi:MAG: MFS transporter [Lewinellaceae bacterium]|nr:MFS transporter [Lewinellaceae bacterium]
MKTTPTSSQVHGSAILSLGLLHAVFIFSLLAYDQYQGIILETHRLDRYGHFLEIWSLVWAVAVPPLAGWLADRYSFTHGKKYLVINVAATITSLLFVLVASTFSLRSGAGLARMLPFLMAAWILGMHFFHSPSHSFVREFAPPKDWPLANALILLIGNLIFALSALIVPFVQSLGVVFTFVAGGVLLGLATFWFIRKSKTVGEHEPESEEPVRKTNWVWSILTGLLVGSAFFVTSYAVLHTQAGSTAPATQKSLIFVLAALVAVPMGWYSKKTGAKKMLLVSAMAFGLFGVGGLFLFRSGFAWLDLVLMAACLGAMESCGLPLALSKTLARNKGLSTGLYWSGFYLISFLFFFFAP